MVKQQGGKDVAFANGKTAKSFDSNRFPVLFLDENVLFPRNSIPLGSLSGMTQNQMATARRNNIRIFVITASEEEALAHSQNTYMATEAVIRSTLKLPNGETGIIVEGIRRIQFTNVTRDKLGIEAEILEIDEVKPRATSNQKGADKLLQNLSVSLASNSAGVTREFLGMLSTADDSGLICDLIAPYLSISIDEKIALIGELNIKKRVNTVIEHLQKEHEILEMSRRIGNNVRTRMLESARQSFLKEQLQTIKKELGETDDPKSEVGELKADLKALDLPEETWETLSRELEKLEMTNPSSPEYHVGWTYLNYIKELPWSQEEEEFNASLEEAKILLNKKHYGLEKVKEKIFEYLAVANHRGTLRGQILLLVGPPGVGKTSLAQSIATALNRPYRRVSLGGVKDEAEIRGHRRTYVGAMPGKIIQAIKNAHSTKAVLCLDEIDKVGRERDVDLASALLEVLDPEQNKSFIDHYLSVPFDLSNIVFIATANDLGAIPAPLRDRMDIVTLSSYTEEEKGAIAKDYIIPEIRRELCLKASQFKLQKKTITHLTRHYTKEAGVRELKRQLTSLARKLILNLADSKNKPIKTLEPVDLLNFLGAPKFLEEPKDQTLPVGVSVGLAYTSVGGEILYIEANRTKSSSGKGSLTLTGRLGKVMQESAHATLSFYQANASLLKLDSKTIGDYDIHLHLPDGATPKDGPSAGVAILIALGGLFVDLPISSDLAMTGEITLRGQVLPVGGIKEKLIAAHRYGKTKIMIPYDNILDLEELPDEVLNGMEITPIRTMEEALMVAGLIKVAKSKLPKPIRYKKGNLSSMLKKTSGRHDFFKER